MKDIKQTIADNLINLRKKNNLTQNQLAQKVNYSDNAISRWEHAEVTPSIETLQHIAEVFNVPLTSLIEDNAVRTAQKNDKLQLINTLAIILISVSLVWLIAVISFACILFIFDYTFWQIFVWAIPIVCLVMYPFHKYWGRHIYKFVIFSVFLWTLIVAIYIQFYFLTNFMWLTFMIGIPIQVALAIWAFVKPKPKKIKILTKEQLEKKEQKEKTKLEKKI